MVTLIHSKVSDNLWHISKPSFYKDEERCSLWVYAQFRDLIFRTVLKKIMKLGIHSYKKYRLLFP